MPKPKLPTGRFMPNADAQPESLRPDGLLNGPAPNSPPQTPSAAGAEKILLSRRMRFWARLNGPSDCESYVHEVESLEAERLRLRDGNVAFATALKACQRERDVLGEGLAAARKELEHLRGAAHGGLEERMATWVRTRIGEDHLGRKERAMRLLEEALELAQSEGIPERLAAAQAAHVFARPHGVPFQEAGGVAVCLLGWCYAAGFGLSHVIANEFQRIEAKPIEAIRGSLARKTDADLVCCLETSAPGIDGVCDALLGAGTIQEGVPENRDQRIQMLLERNNLDMELRRKAEAERDALRESIQDLTRARNVRIMNLEHALKECEAGNERLRVGRIRG